MTPLPGVIRSIKKGFNLVSKHAYLLVIPLVLDLFLLFGPKLRINEALQPTINAAFSQMGSGLTRTGAAQFDALADLTGELLSTINLFGFIRTYPVGVNVLFSAAGDSTPLGMSATVQMRSLLLIIWVMFLMMGIGIAVGTLYYSLIADRCVRSTRKFSFANYWKQFLSVLLLCLILFTVILIFSFPASCLFTAAAMMSSFMYTVLLLIMAMVICWIIIPIYFIVFSIFTDRLNFSGAVKQSVRMFGWSGGIGLRYMLFAVLISYGLGYVWAIPPQSSWMILISIFGHAFISTALLTGALILFKDLTQWEKDNQQFLQWRKSFPKFFIKESNKNDRTQS